MAQNHAEGVEILTQAGPFLKTRLDLMETFRSAVVEALALRLLTQRILGAGHFEARDGGVLLNDRGRHTWLQHYEKSMLREFLSETVGQSRRLQSSRAVRSRQFSTSASTATLAATSATFNTHLHRGPKTPRETLRALRD